MIMKKIKKIGLSIFLFTSLFLGVLSPHGLAMDDGIIAVVNDEVITLKDLHDYIRQTYIGLVAEGVRGPQLKDIMLDLEKNGINKLIEDKIILTKANEIGMEVRDKLIDQRVARVKSRYASEQDFLNSLIEHGATVTDLRNKILEQLKIKYVIDHEVKAKIFVNPQEVTDFYEQNKKDFLRKERVNVDSIYIMTDNDKAGAEKKAKEALSFLQEGKDFKTISEQYSDTPSVGIVEKGQFLPEIEDVIFALEEGQISSLVEVESGYYIFKPIGKIPASIASLREVNDTVFNLLYKNKFRQRFTNWLDKLKKQAYIEIKH